MWELRPKSGISMPSRSRRIVLHRMFANSVFLTFNFFRICDAMLLADKHILIPGENGNVRMSEAVDDPVAFTNLSDHVGLLSFCVTNMLLSLSTFCESMPTP